MATNAIKAVVFDIDGSIMPQGGPIDPRVAAIFCGLQKLGVKLGPATGKNCDYARGLACGVGVVWDFVIGETGAQVLETIAYTPPAFRQRSVIKGGSKDLATFAKKIALDPIARTFDFRGELQSYRPELKESILTLFPPRENVEETLGWVPYFQGMVDLCELELKIQRHKDGCIDILPLEVNKSLGVHEVCRMLACNLENLVTVVDGVNDHELILPGAHTIAVGNAVPVIKETTTSNHGFVASHDDGMGFAEGLLHFAKKEMFEDSSAVAGLVITNFPELVSS